MPGGDRTGPLGMGPVTGRGAGICASYRMRGCIEPSPFRRGLGLRQRYGLGYPGSPYASRPYSHAEPVLDEEEALKEQIHYLKRELDELERRLQEINRQE